MDLNSAMETYAEAWVAATTQTPILSHQQQHTQEEVDHESHYSTSVRARDDDVPRANPHSPTGIKNIMLHCVVEQCSGPPTFDSSIGLMTSIEKDGHVSLPSCTLVSELIRSALLQLSYATTDTMTAIGAIQINNWKLLSFDQITNDLLSMIGDLFSSVASAVTLRIRICSRPRERSSHADIKDKLLTLMLPQLLHLVSLGCPIDQETLTSFTNKDSNVVIDEKTREDFLSWYSRRIGRLSKTIQKNVGYHDTIDRTKRYKKTHKKCVFSETEENCDRDLYRAVKKPRSNSNDDSLYEAGRDLNHTGGCESEKNGHCSETPPRQASPDEEDNDRMALLCDSSENTETENIGNSSMIDVFDSEFEIPELLRWFEVDPKPNAEQLHRHWLVLNERRKFLWSEHESLTETQIEGWFKHMQDFKTRSDKFYQNCDKENVSEVSSVNDETEQAVNAEVCSSGGLIHPVKIEHDAVLDCSKSTGLTLPPYSCNNSSLNSSHDSGINASHTTSKYISHSTPTCTSFGVQLNAVLHGSSNHAHSTSAITSLARRYYSEDASEEEILLQKWFILNPNPNVAQMSEFVTVLNSLESRNGLKTVVLENVAQWFKNARTMFKNAISNNRQEGDAKLLQEHDRHDVNADKRSDASLCSEDGNKVIKSEADETEESVKAPDCGGSYEKAYPEKVRLSSPFEAHVSPILSSVPPAAHTPLNIPHMPYPLAVHYLQMNAASQYMQQAQHKRQPRLPVLSRRSSPQPSSYDVSQDADNATYSYDRKRRTRVFIDPITEIPKLECWFAGDSHPSAFMIDKFCEELNRSEFRRKNNILEPKNIQLWFKNHRAKVKRLKMEFSLGNSVSRDVNMLF